MQVQIPKPFRDLIKKTARYKGWYSGRGCAKTHSFATAALMRAAKDGWLFLCCREHQKSIADSVKKVLDLKIEQLGLNDYFHSTQKEIGARSGGGFLFEGLHANVQGIRSKEGVHAVWVEEANTVTQSSLDILIPTIRKPLSELWFSWNPRFSNDPVDRMFRGAELGELTDFDKEIATKSGYDEWSISRRVHIEDNKFFPEVLRAEMERDKRRDVDRYRHVWLGEYAQDSNARVFRNWKIGVMEVPEGTRPYYGADWGFVIDPTVLVRCYVFPDQRRLYVDAEISKVGVEIDRTPAFFDSLCAVEPSDDPFHPRKMPITADSSRPEIISYLQRNGFPRIAGARKGPGSVEEGVEFLRSYDITINPNCTGVIREMTLYSFEIDPLTNEVLPTLADKENHFIDALRYAVEAIRRNVGKVIMPILVSAPRTAYGDNVDGLR